jgi:hypothetical protein
MAADTVTDDVTGLLWQRAAAPTSMTQAAGRSYCAGLSLASLAGWRLPTRVELLSIVFPGASSPALVPGVFDGPTGTYWTASAATWAGSDGWVVDFSNGAPSNLPSSSESRVRCVRAGGGAAANPPTTGPPPGRYALTADTATDVQTQLTWARATAGPFGAGPAASYCSGLVLDGLTGWRLPTAAELQSVFNPRVDSPGIDTGAFPGTQSWYHWSSTPQAGGTGYKWAVNFQHGQASAFDPAAGFNARCVR